MEPFDLSPAEPERSKFVAEYESKCAACGEWIREDDPIVKDDDENWVHEQCLE